jgi:hypothetical protein
MWPASIHPYRFRMSGRLGLTLVLAMTFIQPATADWQSDYQRARRQRDIAGWDLERAKACVERASAKIEALRRRVNFQELEIWKRNYEQAWRNEKELENAWNYYRQNRHLVPNWNWSERARSLWLKGQELDLGTPPNSTPNAILRARDEATSWKGKLDHFARERAEMDAAVRERDDCQSRIPRLEEIYRARQEQLDAFERGIIPPDDSDIERLMGLAERWKAHGRACAGMECPELECTSARRYLQALFDAEAALEDMVRRLRAARDDARRHFHALHEQLAHSQARQDLLEKSLAAQQLLYDAGSALLEIADIHSALSKLADYDQFMDASWFDRADALYNIVRNTESSLTTVINRLSDNEHKGMFATLEKGIGRTIRFDPNIVDGIGGAKDTLVNLKDILEEVKKWKEGAAARAIQPEEMFTLWQTTGRAAQIRGSLMQIAARPLKAWAGMEIEKVKDELRELARIIAAEDSVIGPAAEYMWRINGRRYAAEDALEALREARQAATDCVMRGCKGTQTSQPARLVPSSGWGEALRDHNRRLPGLIAALSGGGEAPSGRICTGQPVTLVLRQSAKKPLRGRSIVEVVENVGKAIETADKPDWVIEYTITARPRFERRPDGSVVARFDAVEMNIKDDPGMPDDMRQAGRREAAAVSTRLRRAAVGVDAAANGEYSVDLHSAAGALSKLSAIGESARASCREPNPANVYRPAGN